MGTIFRHPLTTGKLNSKCLAIIMCMQHLGYFFDTWHEHFVPKGPKWHSKSGLLMRAKNYHPIMAAGLRSCAKNCRKTLKRSAGLLVIELSFYRSCCKQSYTSPMQDSKNLQQRKIKQSIQAVLFEPHQHRKKESHCICADNPHDNEIYSHRFTYMQLMEYKYKNHTSHSPVTLQICESGLKADRRFLRRFLSLLWTYLAFCYPLDSDQSKLLSQNI